MSDFMKILGYGLLHRKKEKKTLPPEKHLFIVTLQLIDQLPFIMVI